MARTSPLAPAASRSWDVGLAGLRAAADARAAEQRGNFGEAARKRELTASYQAPHEVYRQRETVFAGADHRVPALPP